MMGIFGKFWIILESIIVVSWKLLEIYTMGRPMIGISIIAISKNKNN
jgi:hypothetical protein